jgi:hypothetical protein
MKNSTIPRIVIIIATFLTIVSITFIITIFPQKNKPDTQETVAMAVLTKTYGATLNDYENLTNAITQSTGNSDILLDYLHTMYGEQLTENGYKIFIDNRMPSRALNTAYEENSNLKVTSIELKAKDALTGRKHYDFTIKLYSEKNTSKTFIFKGNITLIQENGQWKVDGAAPD